MSFTLHLAPLGFVLLLWFCATGLVAWLDNRSQASFGLSLRIAGMGAMIGVAVTVATAHDASTSAAYMSFAAAFAVWGWHELAFLTGAAAGPSRLPCPPEACGWARVRAAVAVIAWHELALIATLGLLALVSWGAANATGAAAFGILFAMRLSAKLNVFLGVPNFSTEMLPEQLGYLKSYFRARRFNALMPVSLIAGTALTAWLGASALSNTGGAAVSLSLLTGLAALGVVEHLFLVLPYRDGGLWRWAIPAKNYDEGGRYGL